MYDVVIIGAGSAGSVIAARASEHPNRTVLLVEAGPDYPVLAETPFDLVNGYDNSYVDHDWGLRYKPMPEGRTQPLPRGRVTGGSSAVNTTIALRGVPEDYDGWAALGNPEWAWERVLPAFRRLERDLDFGAEPYHGDAGPITIRRHPPSELTVTHAAFTAAADELGYPVCADHNDPDGWGAGPQPMNKLGRLRVSAAVGYLAPARIRPNLTIEAETTIAHLVVERGRAVAAVVEGPDGTQRRVEGRLFVLCAGAIGSPAILARSGIGPAGELNRLGIEPLADVAGVGANLDDHPATTVVCQVKDAALAARDLPLIQTILRYTAPGSDQRNDAQIELVTFANHPSAAPAFGLAAVLEATFGRGRLHLASADPHAPPVIESGFGTDERDVDRLADVLLDAVAFARSGPLAELTEAVVHPRLPLDRDGARWLATHRLGSGYHPCGTARMGPAGDPGAVVDQYGRAHAVDNLVVADASIMPFVPRANTNLTSIMIGEMVGEWLRTAPSRYGL
ncbi:MAG: GMC family oxidoreductase N-terminal domain-containing protein [Acidimicrobiia bacterium]|nr:GMC family oxidoreductase N-terminal domain-containing protein [Acidimicrobiia bacterium]